MLKDLAPPFDGDAFETLSKTEEPPRGAFSLEVGGREVGIHRCAPKDPETGLPLPIIPSCRFLPADRPNEADWHHLWTRRCHPAYESAGGLALRNSMVQLIDVELHNQGKGSYHAHYDWIDVPEGEDEQFGLIIPSVAGFIPELGVDLSTEEPVIRPFTPSELEFMRIPDDERGYSYRHVTYRYEPIRKFLTDYVVKQDLSHIEDVTIEEFLTTPDENTRRFLGHYLLAQAAEVAAEKIEPAYRINKKRGLLHPLVPAQPYRKIKYTLGSPLWQEVYIFPKLSERLMSAVDQQG